MNVTEILQAITGCFHEITVSHGLYGSLFLAGLVGGVTHCGAMCGPFVVAQSGHLHKMSQRALLPYHLGRMTTYVAMAVMFSSVLNVAFLFLPARGFVIAPLLITAGVIFLITAMPRLSILFPWASRLQIGVPYRFFKNTISRLSKKRGIWGQYAMGLLLGFMPCGLIVSALMAASSAPSPQEAALAMAAFAFGTMPALVGISCGSHWLAGRYPVLLPRLRKGMMIWSALWLFAMAGFLLI